MTDEQDTDFTGPSSHYVPVRLSHGRDEEGYDEEAFGQLALVEAVDDDELVHLDLAEELYERLGRCRVIQDLLAPHLLLVAHRQEVCVVVDELPEEGLEDGQTAILV